MLNKTELTLLITCLCVIQQCNAVAQITTIAEVVKNAEIKAKLLRSNDEISAQSNTEYFRLHSVEATNALSKHQLQLLDLTATPSGTSNYFSQNHSPQELVEFTNTVQYYLTNPAAQSSYYLHVHGMTEAEFISNASLIMSKPSPWPDTPDRLNRLKICAAALRSAIDTNQIEVACNKITNQSVAITSLKALSKEAEASLDEFASFLTNPKLEVYGNFGEIQCSDTGKEKVSFLFWSQHGLVRQFNRKIIDGHISVSARFSQSGKLLDFEKNSSDTNGVFRTRLKLDFSGDGTLRSWMNSPLQP